MRRLFMLFTVILLALVLGACATATEPTQEPAAPPPAPTDAPAEPTSAPEPTSPPEPTAMPEPTQVPPEPITVVDGFGNEITLAGPADRVISLAPSNTEILFAVGAGEQLVGRDAFSDYPAEALEVADIGGGFGELDIETILAADPDLVLAADITPPEQVQQLTDLGLTVFTLGNPLTFEDLFDNLRTVALLTGHKEETEALIASLSDRLEAVREKVAQAAETPLVFYELDATDPNAPWTAGPGTFVDTLITEAGGTNLGAELEGAWAQISVEQLIALDPDVIILGDFTWGGVTPEDVAARGGWESLSAVVHGKVFTFDDNLVSRPGPRMIDGLEQMAALLHPKLFE